MKKFLSILLIVLPFMPAWAQNAEQTGSEPQKTWYGEELYLNNIRYDGIGPTSTAFIPYSTLNSIEVSYSNIDGTLRAVDDGRETDDFNVSVKGAKKVGSKVSLEGKFDYVVDHLNDSRWNNTTLLSARNPFIIADSLYYLRADGTDSIPNDKNKELFNLNGSLTYQASDRLLLGLNGNFRVANQTDQSDPRFEAKAARVTIIPGMEYKLGDRHSLGFSALAELYHENSSSSVEDNIYAEHTVTFNILELGSVEINSDYSSSRRYEGKVFGGAFTSVLEGPELSNFAEVRGKFTFEEAIDGGSSYSRHGGEYKEFYFGAMDRLRFYTGNLVHNIQIEADMLMGSGKTFKHNTRYDELGNTIYEVTSGSVTQKETDINADLFYRIDMLQSSNPTFTAKVNGGMEMVKVTQYPDSYHANYTLAHAGLMATKRWFDNKVRYSITAQGAYNTALKELDLTLPSATMNNKKFGNGYFTPKYEYYAASYFGAGLLADAAYPIKGKDGNIYWLKAGVGYNLLKYTGDYNKFDDRQTLTAKLTLTF